MPNKDILALLIRLGLAAAPLLFSYVAKNTLNSQEFSEVYKVISTAVVLSVLIKFGADLSLKRDTATEVSIHKYFIFGYGYILNVLVFVIFNLKYNFVESILAWLIYYSYSFVSVKGLGLRLSGKSWSSLMHEPSVIYLILLTSLPARTLGYDLYLIVACFVMCVYYILVTKLRGVDKIKFGIDFNGISSIKRISEGLMSSSITAAQWLLIYYLANQDVAQTYILAYQLILSLNVVRSIELNWFFNKNLKFLQEIENTNLSILKFITKRAIIGCLAASIIFGAIVKLELEVEPTFIIIFLIYEVVAFGTSPVFSLLQKETSKGQINFLLFVSTAPLLFCLIASLPLIMIYLSVCILIFVRCLVVSRYLLQR